MDISNKRAKEYFTNYLVQNLNKYLHMVHEEDI